LNLDTKYRFAFREFSIGLILIGVGISSMLLMAQILAVQEFNATYTEQGIIGAIRAIPYVISAVIVGYFLSYVNKKYALALSSIIVALSSVMTALSDSMTSLYISQLVFSLGVAFYWPVAESILAHEFQEEERLKAYGKYSASWNGGFLAGAIFSGVVGEMLGLRTMFILSALVSLLALIPILRLNTEKSTHVPKISIQYFAPLTPAYLITLPIIAIFGAVLTIVPGYAWNIGLVVLQIGVMAVPMWTLRVGASLYLAFNPPKRINLTLVLIGLSITSSLGINIFLQNYLTLMLLLTVVGIAISYFYAVMFYIISTVAKTRTEFAIGGYESVIGMGFFIGPPLSGLLADVAGVPFMFAALALVGLAAAAIGSTTYREIK